MKIPTFTATFALEQEILTARLLGDLGRQGIERPLWYFDNGSQGPLDLIEDANVMARTQVGHDLAEIIDCTDIGLYQMWNMAIDKAKKKAKQLHADEWNLAILNNDLIIGPHFIAGLDAALRIDERLYAVCANYDNRVVDTPVKRVEGTYGKKGFAGFAFMVAGERLDAAGIRFDENYSWWYGDDDFVAQIDAAGGHYAMARDAKVVHLFEQTASKNKDRLQPTIDKDRDYFFEKWDIAV
jgi:hypothetical protein